MDAQTVVDNIREIASEFAKERGDDSPGVICAGPISTKSGTPDIC